MSHKPDQPIGMPERVKQDLDKAQAAFAKTKRAHERAFEKLQKVLVKYHSFAMQQAKEQEKAAESHRRGKHEARPTHSQRPKR